MYYTRIAHWLHIRNNNISINLLSLICSRKILFYNQFPLFKLELTIFNRVIPFICFSIIPLIFFNFYKCFHFGLSTFLDPISGFRRDRISGQLERIRRFAQKRSEIYFFLWTRNVWVFYKPRLQCNSAKTQRFLLERTCPWTNVS